jgi:formylmethanofuran dehydrogenase subunit E
MLTLAEYENLATAAHGHMCAGQVLGLRMAIHGLELRGIGEPEGKDRKHLVTFVEIDRRATDAIPVVTGCRLGKRALEFRDFDKVTGTFCDLETNGSAHVVARESSNNALNKCIPASSTRTPNKCRLTAK